MYIVVNMYIVVHFSLTRLLCFITRFNKIILCFITCPPQKYFFSFQNFQLNCVKNLSLKLCSLHFFYVKSNALPLFFFSELNFKMGDKLIFSALLT